MYYSCLGCAFACKAYWNSPAFQGSITYNNIFHSHIPSFQMTTVSPRGFRGFYNLLARQATVSVGTWTVTTEIWLWTWQALASLFIARLVLPSDTTVETLYSTIYYSKYFIELNFDKSTQYVALWTHKRHPIPRPFGRAMECLLWVLQQKLTVL